MRNKIVKQAQAWLGKNEKDGSFKVIIDTYNKINPLPRGYKVKYTDEWCATFVSAVSYVCGALDVAPAECSCSKMIEKHKSLGSWIENDAYIPSPGDFVLYDWQDTGKGENKGSVEHIGIVVEVSGGIIQVIEGNYSESVKARNLKVNGKYIRGFIAPKYKTEEVKNTVEITLNILKKGSNGEQVKTLQRLLSALGYKMKDGWKVYGVDGSFGTATYNAVIKFQKARGLGADGIVGEKTWNELLKG